MSDEIFLQQLREELSQGDVIEALPVGAVIGLHVARVYKDKDGKEVQGDERNSIVYSYPPRQPFRRPPTPPLFKRNNDAPESILFDAQLRRCVVISDDCAALAKAGNKAIEFNPTERVKNWPWHVAPLEPWPSDGEVVGLSDGSEVPLGKVIEQGRVKRYLALPELRGPRGDLVLERSRVDLRFITPLRPSLFVQGKRIASMTDVGVSILAAKVYTYFSGFEVPVELKCPSCSRTHSLRELLLAQPENEQKRDAGSIAVSTNSERSD